ncbi:MAG: hypothetical protein ACTSO5_14525 [Candidatus Heimdallarchaeaceae archaeon]
MKLHNKYYLGLSLMVLIFFSASQTLADEGIGYQELNNVVTLTVDDLTIMVNAGGQVPKFHYQLESGLSYNIMFKLLAEFYDFNEDGVFQYNETNIWGSDPPEIGEIRYHTILALPSVIWEFSGFETEDVAETTVAVHFNFTSANILDPFYAGVELAIVAHLYFEDQIIDGYQLEGGNELKFDLVVKNWPWQKDDSKLAIRFDISSDNNEDEIEQEPGIPINTGSNTTGMEKKAEHTEDVKQTVSIRSGDAEGYFGYATQSQNRINNEYQTKGVEASYSSDENDNVQYYLCFEHLDDELIYDPSIGSIGSESAGIGTISLLIIGFGTLAVMANYIYRKKRN